MFSTEHLLIFSLVVVAQVTPVAINNIGYQYFIVYTCIGACIPITVFFLFPETKGRTLEELDTIFKDSPSVLGTVKYAKYKPMLAPEDVPHSKSEDIKFEEKV